MRRVPGLHPWERIVSADLLPGEPDDLDLTAGTRHLTCNTDADSPCSSGPGLCLVLRCRYNLLLDTRASGTIDVPRSPDGGRTRRPLVIQQHRTRHGPVPDYVADRAADAVAENAEHLMATAGSTCAIDVGPIDLAGIGRVIGATRQRAEQLVSHALVKLRRRVDEP